MKISKIKISVNTDEKIVEAINDEVKMGYSDAVDLAGYPHNVLWTIVYHHPKGSRGTLFPGCKPVVIKEGCSITVCHTGNA